MKRQMNKKAEMGIGTLIIFIAMLLVAAVAAGVLIQTAGSLQERALTTGDQAKGQIATNVRVIEVSATNGQDGNLENVEQIMKLSPGSNAIKIDQTLLTMNVYDRTATLLYRGTTGTYENDATNGYYTLSVETLSTSVNNATNTTLTEDYDGDGTLDDAMIVGNDLVFYLSAGTTETITGVCDGSAQSDNFTTSGTFIDNVEVVGTCSANLTSAVVTVTPANVGEGFFTVEYLQRGTNPVDGNLQTGDVIRVYFEAPRAIGEDEEVRMNFIPKIGTPTLTQFLTPEVISIERVYLYP